MNHPNGLDYLDLDPPTKISDFLRVEKEVYLCRLQKSTEKKGGTNRFLYHSHSRTDILRKNTLQINHTAATQSDRSSSNVKINLKNKTKKIQ